MNHFFRLSTLILLMLSLLHPAVAEEKQAESKFVVNYEKFVLENGLEVVFHIDRSDPVVAVNLTAHVGSSRETEGRTGFAHMFEHLLFLESENLGKGGLDQLSARIGGSGANGSTSRDRTNYLQTVPKDALEKMLWAEADKLGWFINTVTEQVLEKEKQVVKNEKRQGVDNTPYGHNWYVIDKNLYPADHPYSWQVIGSLEDLQAATLDDVKTFFKRWYVPNNVTLTLAGDFDPVQAKKWVQKYFAEIERGEDITPLAKRSGVLTETKKRYHEDNFANLPQLTRVYPTVAQYEKDQYALDVLFAYLSEGKSAPLYKVLVEDKQLVPQVRMFHGTSELAGQVYLLARAYAGTNLDAVNLAIDEAFAMFEKNGISPADLTRIKASQETAFYNGLSSVLGKGAQLAYYNIYTGDPGYATTEIENILAVTTADVMRVYEQYIKGKHYVATSFVPKGKVALALTDSTRALVVEEQVVQGAEKEVNPDIVASYEKTPSSFDRSVEPPYGEKLTVNTPQIWQSKVGSMLVSGIQTAEVPLVDFELVLDGGQLFEEKSKAGVSNILAQMMTKGTKTKTPEALEEAIEMLGASIDVIANQEDIRIRVNTLARNYTATMALVEEIIMEPRWDESEFALVKQQTVAFLEQQKSDPSSIADNQFNRLIYSDNDIRSENILGNAASVSAITLADLQRFHQTKLSPHLARLHVVGDVAKTEVLQSLNGLKKRWKASDVEPATPPVAVAPEASKTYFYDVPNAKQTVLYIGYPALAATDPDYYPAVVMNYILGGGGFASQLTQNLREGKGYTYGIFSRFEGSKQLGPFSIFSRVRSNVTLESAQLIKQILENYGTTYSEADLATTKSFLTKSNA